MIGNRLQVTGNKNPKGLLAANLRKLRKISKPENWAILGALALVLALLSFPAIVSAQAEAEQHPQSSATASSQPAANGEQQRDDSQAAKEKSSEEDQNEAFRHSDSVKMVARITHLSLDAAYWLCIVLNFLVVFIILWVALKKILPTAFRNRSEAIQKRLEEARKASEDAKRRLTDVEARLSRLDAEIEQMRRDAEAGGHAEEERVMKAAEEERRRIVESAEQEISSAAGAARRELKAYAAQLAVSLAEKKIEISKSTDETLVRNFASRLGKGGN